jgi:membrane protein implicated in regulation of membrane protease activity
MDELNPIEWHAWLYGTGNAGFFVVFLLAVVFVSFLWSKGIGNYKKQRDARAAATGEFSVVVHRIKEQSHSGK